MTKLTDLAGKISDKSPAIKAFAQEAAVEIDALTVRVDKLEAGTPPPPPPPPPPPTTGALPRFGISTGASPSDAVLDQCAALAADYVRFDGGNDATTQARVNRVHGHGQHVLLIIRGNAGTISSYWKDKLPLRMYELMNEPDLNGYTGSSYAAAVKPWCDQIRAADPQALIWLPGCFKGGDQAGRTPPDFARAVCDAGCSFDVWSDHVRDDDPGWNDPRNGWHYAAQVRQILDASGRQNVKMASSESHAFYREGATGQANKVTTYLGYVPAGKLASVAVYRVNYFESGNMDSSFLDAAGAKRPAWTAFHDYAAAHPAASPIGEEAAVPADATHVEVEQGRNDLWFWQALSEDGAVIAHGGGLETKDECSAQAAEMFPDAEVAVV